MGGGPNNLRPRVSVGLMRTSDVRNYVSSSGLNYSALPPRAWKKIFDCLRLKYSFSGLGCVVSLVLLGEEFAGAIIFLSKILL